MSRKIIIFTDVGEEIDDEIALYWFMNYRLRPEDDVTIVFTNGILKAEITPTQRYEKFKEYFPDAPGSIAYIHKLHTLRQIKNEHYTHMLQIAPLRGIDPVFFQQNTFDCLYLMGQRAPPGAINTYKSFGERSETNADAWDEYEAQLVHLAGVSTVEIGTTISRKVPFTAFMVSQLPKIFKEQTLNKAYEQFVGRVPSVLPFCYGVTFGANYPTLMTYVSVPTLKPKFKAFKKSHHKDVKIDKLARGYYSSIKIKKADADAETDILKIKDMIMVVEFMTGGYYRNASLQKGTDNFARYNLGKERWSKAVVRYNCSLTPAYDLLAMFVMENNLSQEDLADPVALTRHLEDSFRIKAVESPTLMLKNAFLTGIPENGAIMGTGKHTSGFVLQVCNEHPIGSPSLTGSYKLIHGDMTHLITTNMPVSSSVLKNMSESLDTTSQKNFQKIRQAILDVIGVEHNAQQLNTFLFHPSQWTAIKQ